MSAQDIASEYTVDKKKCRAYFDGLFGGVDLEELVVGAQTHEKRITQRVR